MAASTSRPQEASTLRLRMAAIAALGFAGLLLEVAYTRIVSYKHYYYFVYLVIGLSLLGIGSGAVLVAISRRLKAWSTERIVAVFSLAGAVTIPAGFLVVARLPIDTLAIWDYGTRASWSNLVRLGITCFVLFATFVALGVVISVLLARAGESVGRLYFADLVGAGLGCVLAIPFIAWLSPPLVVVLAAVVFALVGLAALPVRLRTVSLVGAVAVVLVGSLVVVTDPLPEVRNEASKAGGRDFSYSEWGPVFRVDVAELPVLEGRTAASALLLHDGTFGSALHEWDGDVGSLTRFERDPRLVPFRVLDDPPERELIIGSAGGNEILASLYFGAPRIEAVELNPVTVSLLTDHYYEYTGFLVDRPELELHQGDGRSYLARRGGDYDLVWFVAPDSYAASNAASSGAFVLSESYLYTREMIVETLEHLTDDGIMVVQFGELDFETSPNRTSRYVVTARAALEEIGVADPSAHLAVAATLVPGGGDLSTIIVKRSPFTPGEVERFVDASAAVRSPDDAPGGDVWETRTVYVPGDGSDPSVVARLAGSSAADVDRIVAEHPRAIDVVTDDSPFFWHFARFDDVLRDITRPLTVRDWEDSVGERVLLLLLGFSAIYAAAFLLLPFVAVRRTWAVLPRKGLSFVYFAGLGLGFMMIEIVMIQRLVRFLGYPTLSLTVTLATILVAAGLGALASSRLSAHAGRAVPALVGVLLALTLGYELGLEPVLDGLQGAGLPVRIAAAVALLAPLGFVLGMFMPLGLGLVSRLSTHGEAYAAWCWAVNGFFSVIGSVLTTILSMSFGFATTQRLAVAIYLVAALAFWRLHASTPEVVVVDDEGAGADAATGVEPEAARV